MDSNEGHASIWERLSDQLSPANYVPQLAPGELEVRRFESRGAPYYMVKHIERRAYVRLAPEDYFIFQQIDGRRPVSDLVLAYFRAHNTFAFERVASVVHQLRASGFLTDPPRDAYERLSQILQRGTARTRLASLSRTLLYREFPIRNVDSFVTGVYRLFGWVLFTRPCLLLLTIIATSGLLLFFVQQASGRYQFPQLGDSYLIAALLFLPLDLGVGLIHEMAHALAAKHYSREVPRAGFLIYLGSPAYFVDTTDVWMASQRARIASAAAGTFSGFVLGGLCCFAQLFPEPGTLASGLLYQLAFVGYLDMAFNLVPLLELDGYYILVDLLGIPRLRAKSFAFLRQQLLPKLTRREHFNREERIFTIYGLLAGAFTAFSVLVAIWFWNRQISLLVSDLLGREGVLPKLALVVLLVVLGGPLVLGLWSVLVGLGRHLLRGARRGWGHARDWHMRQRLSLLNKLPFLEDTGLGALRRIAAQLRDESFGAGTVVIREGDQGDRFYLIRSGRAEVLKLGDDDLPHKLAELGPGDYFGEIALLRNVPRTATVRAMDDLAAYSLERRHFEALLAPHLASFETVRARLEWREQVRTIPAFTGLHPA